MDFLKQINIECKNCNDEEIIKLALGEIEEKTNDFYLATRNLFNDNYDVNNNPFSALHDVLYESIAKYTTIIEPTIKLDKKQLPKVRTAIIETLIDDLDHLVKLFGEQTRFDYDYRLAKNHHIAEIPPFLIAEICEKIPDIAQQQGLQIALRSTHKKKRQFPFYKILILRVRVCIET
ncbi:unnamed protein product [Rotaria socialis]|uniref:Uncharacterized protein n=1 Tax=Rotaria socialis TaxID=392032 RepID=A0A820ZCE0_9BILA|nr:unnamed protein product [Rotaria socialis]CAF4561631.1 unnamed protein product [Rotaria socialis]